MSATLDRLADPAFRARAAANDRSAPAGPASPWTGSWFVGQTLLVQQDGDAGNMLRMARYLPMAKARGGRVLLQAPPSLRTLLSRLPGVDHVVDAGKQSFTIDLACPITSLPLRLGSSLDSLPAASGYLAADPALLPAWRGRLADDDARRGATPALRVGLVQADRHWSMTPPTWQPLLAGAPGAAFYSLPPDQPARQVEELAMPIRPIDHTAHITSFDDAAALISLLDLVIAMDTATAHLAAALGRPVWLLSSHDQGRCWLPGRVDTPWYDGMRIFAPPSPDAWGPPLARMAAEMEASALPWAHQSTEAFRPGPDWFSVR